MTSAQVVETSVNVISNSPSQDYTHPDDRTLLYDMTPGFKPFTIKSFFPYKDNLAPSFRSKVAYRANCWDCNDFYLGKTKRRLRDRKTEHFKALTTNCHESAIADHVFLTNHIIKWDHFEILATGRSDTHCKIKESLLIRDLKSALNEKVGSEKLYLYY